METTAEVFVGNRPSKPEPWDCDDDPESESMLLQASQQTEEKETQRKLKKTVTSSSARWGSPKTSEDIKSIRRAGIPAKTLQQTTWALSVWKEWATYRREVTKEADEILHELKDDFTTMDVDNMNYWLCRFVVEARKKNGAFYPPNTV